MVWISFLFQIYLLWVQEKWRRNQKNNDWHRAEAQLLSLKSVNLTPHSASCSFPSVSNSHWFLTALGSYGFEGISRIRPAQQFPDLIKKVCFKTCLLDQILTIQVNILIIPKCLMIKNKTKQNLLSFSTLYFPTLLYYGTLLKCVL